MMLLPIYFIQTDFRKVVFCIEEKQVEVIKKVDGPVIRDRRKMGKPLTITRKRVAAYVRVSTNGEEQIQSFNSQKQYYQDKIDSNKEWVMVGIYADEGITGTKTTKREQFLKMIDDCMNGLIDIVITKSVSRFSRNLVDTLQYTNKSITINEAEAETVRLIYDLYLQGYGAYRIAKELTRLGKVNKKGNVKWTDSGVRGILKNEKYKGDLLMGKTYTVDPISKRRLDNHGESNKYYTKNHHEAIISEEEWDKVQDILKSRYRTNENVSDAERIKFARKYAFSSMCQCGFCGTNLTRRFHNQDTKHKKPVWKCRTATNKGIANCPHSKAVDEVVIENAFLEMFKLLAENFDDVLESVLSSVEETLSKDDSTEKLKRIEKEISSFEKKRKKLTDMYLDDKISKEAYDDKYSEISNKLDKCEEEKHLFSDCVLSQKNIADKMKLIRQKIKGADVLDEFDRVVFESIVEKVVVGDMEEDGTADPYKLTFVLKGMDDISIPYARDRYMNLREKAV